MDKTTYILYYYFDCEISRYNIPNKMEFDDIEDAELYVKEHKIKAWKIDVKVIKEYTFRYSIKWSMLPDNMKD